MIVFYATTDDTSRQEIQEALDELCLAHDVVLVTKTSENQGSLPAGTHLPALVDDGRIYQGRSEIHAHLEELEAFRELWYKYGSDACYCDEEGNVE